MKDSVSWRVRRCRSWFDRLAPAAVCSLFWMVARNYDHAMALLPIAAALPALRRRPETGRSLRIATACALAALLLRNLNPIEGEKVRYVAEALAARGIDVLPLVHLRTAVARWCLAYQPWLLVPLAFLLAESLRRLPDSPSPPTGDSSKVPDATGSAVVP